MTMRSTRITGLISFGIVLLLGAGGWLNRWNIYDSIRLRNYQPPAAVVQIATDTTMNDKTRRLFYVYHPDLEDKATFNGHCQSTEKTIVLGCYISGQGIYLSNITEARLQGVIQVTAAHETLHAAYDRLNANDKQHVDDLINQAYTRVTDQRIRDTIEAYRKNGADVTNELHSILGTEVRDLPPELEQYYTRYFTNRKAIVAYSEQYEKVFTEQQQVVTQDDAKLAELKKQIDGLQTGLGSQAQALKSERARLDGLLAAKSYDAYNAAVPGFNAKVGSYNAQVNQTRGLIDQYNSVVAERNAAALEENQLVKAIENSPSTIDSQ